MKITNEWLSATAQRAHGISKEKGFYDEPESLISRLGLIMDEFSEANEARRRGKFANLDGVADLTDEQFSWIFKCCIKDSFEDELADVVIRCLDMAAYEGFEVDTYTIPTTDFIDTKFNCGAFIHDISEYLSVTINKVLSHVIAFCEAEQIDLMQHTELKLKYNATRPRKHGKSY
ncbi:hypothetical protein N9936_01325 [bacterium]|nr:hypothetical protein [bacterium]